MKTGVMVKGFSAGVLTFVSYLLNGWDTALQTLCLFMVIDFVTGILKSIINKKLNSEDCLKGIVKKCCYFLLVIIAVALDRLYPEAQGLSRTLVCYFLVATDGISILENVGECGVPYPKFLKNILEQLKDKSDEGTGLVEKSENKEL